MRWHELRLRDAAVGDDRDRVDLRRAWTTYCCAACRVIKANDAPPGLSAVPNLAMPTTVNEFGPCCVITVVRSPTLRSPS